MATVVAAWAIAAGPMSCARRVAQTPAPAPPPVRCEIEQCGELADEAWEKKKDPTLAERYASIGCAGDDAYACGMLAYVVFSGESPDRLTRTYEIADKGCRLGSPYACYRLGALKETGEGGPKDIPGAVQCYAAACDDEVADACHSLGLLYAQGLVTGRREDAAPVALYERACLLDPGTACGDAGNRYFQGWGVAKDEQKGIQLMQRGCDVDDAHACWILGSDLEVYMRTRPSDEEVLDFAARAKAASVKGCELQNPDACIDAAAWYKFWNRGDDWLKRQNALAKALEISELQCRTESFGRRCATAASLLKNGLGVPKNPALAAEYEQLACQFDVRECPDFRSWTDDQADAGAP